MEGEGGILCTLKYDLKIFVSILWKYSATFLAVKAFVTALSSWSMNSFSPAGTKSSKSSAMRFSYLGLPSSSVCGVASHCQWISGCLLVFCIHFILFALTSLSLGAVPVHLHFSLLMCPRSFVFSSPSSAPSLVIFALPTGMHFSVRLSALVRSHS